MSCLNNFKNLSSNKENGMKKIGLSFCLATAFAVLVSPLSVFAQEEAAPATDVVPSGAEEVSSDTSGLVSFDFKDADIRNVLRIFSHKTGINIAASPDVQGSVTVKLNNVAWDKALGVILEMHDFAYIKEGNVIKVLTRTKVAQEPLKTEVIALDYAKATEVMSTIQSLLTERGNVKQDDRANLLIITDVPSSFEPIIKVLKRLDAPTPQVLIESKLIETTLDVERNFGVKWSVLDKFNLGIIGPNRLKTLTQTVSQVGTGADSVAHTWGFQANPIFNPRDSRFNFQDANNNGSFDEGELGGYANSGGTPFNYQQNDWFVTNTTSGDFTPAVVDPLTGIVTTPSELTFEHIPFTQTNAQSNSNTYSNSKSDLITQESGFTTVPSMNLILSALMSDGGTDILSAPSITTLDNKTAKIKVATDFPIPNFTYNRDSGQYEISGFRELPIGITLSVTPHVAPNGYITMDLLPSISKQEGSLPFTRLGFNYPLVTKEEVETSVLVKDGDTIILGGLLRQSDTYSGQKVPLLHSIPVLGWLFKSKDKKIEKRNLMIFVTPTIIKKQNSSTVMQDKFDFYTKTRENFDETTTIYPKLGVE
jgi:type IV pilus assembly protein PilQ